MTRDRHSRDFRPLRDPSRVARTKRHAFRLVLLCLLFSFCTTPLHGAQSTSVLIVHSYSQEYVTSGLRQGEAAADMVVRYLDGAAVADIAPMESSPNEYIFDGRELKRTDLVLPPDVARCAAILHPVPTFYQRNKDVIITAIYSLLSLFVLSLVVCLFVLLRKHRELLASNRREADARLAAERLSSFGRILDRSDNEIYIFDDRTLHFLHVNHGGQANVGYSMDELRRMTPLDLTPEYTAESFESLIAALRNGTASAVRFTTRHVRKDGTLYPVDVHLQRSAFENQAVFVAVILDISERRRVEKELHASRERAVAADHASSWPT
jgi:PAS domain S-box-containing protein